MAGLLVSFAKMCVAVCGKHDILFCTLICEKEFQNWLYRILVDPNEVFQVISSVLYEVKGQYVLVMISIDDTTRKVNRKPLLYVSEQNKKPTSYRYEMSSLFSLTPPDLKGYGSHQWKKNSTIS